MYLKRYYNNQQLYNHSCTNEIAKDDRVQYSLNS